MQARLTLVTLGVSDLARSRAFYCDALGWRASSAGNEHVVFIEAGGVILGLFSKASLAEDAQVANDGRGFSGITLAQNLGSEEAVDRAIEDARRAGAKITKEPVKTFWGGYAGYFQDPDGYSWEVAHNPFWPLDAEGGVLLPK